MLGAAVTRTVKPFLFLAAIVLLSGLVFGPARAELSGEDKADVARVEAFLNEIMTLEAHFTQLSDSGAVAEGVFYMQRPGLLRFEYEPPSPILIVGTGDTIVFYDSRLGQVSYVPIKATPLAFLAEDKIAFEGSTEVVRVDREPGALAVTLADESRPDQGTVTLIFSDSPMRLRMWRITDAQGKVTTIALSKTRTNIELDPELFRFEDPKPFERTTPPSQ